MAAFNRITLVGNFTRDPEIRYVGSGSAVTKFTLAVNRRSKERDEVDFIDCVAWDKLAETANAYCKKGTSVLVDGRLSIRSYETKEGEKRKATEVVVNTLQFLDKREGGSSSGSDDRGGYQRPAAAPATGGGFGDGDNFEDDEIPF